jgi:hypothetical protein
MLSRFVHSQAVAEASKRRIIMTTTPIRIGPLRVFLREALPELDATFGVGTILPPILSFYIILVSDKRRSGSKATDHRYVGTQ